MRLGIAVAIGALISSMALADKTGHYNCVRIDDGDDWVVDVELKSGTAEFFDNDHWTVLSSTLAASLCPATQKFSGFDHQTDENVEFVFNLLTQSGTLFIYKGEASSTHYAFKCELN